MFGDSEATSDHTPLVHMGSDDELSSQSRLEYWSKDSLVSDRKLASDPPLKEAIPFGWRPREIVLPDNWSIHDFPADMSDKVFSRLRPRFQIPDDVPIRKGDLREKCYDGRSSDVGFYETAFIAGLCLPLSFLHRRLASYIGVSVNQIAPWRQGTFPMIPKTRICWDWALFCTGEEFRTSS